MSFSFRPASRGNAKPLIGLYSESGCGKTMSALLLARGFIGSKGRIGMIETESGRGEAYSDPAEYPEIGGYDVLTLHDDFSPAAYGRAIDAAEKAKLDALIIDSASHEWEGVGGVLGMAAANQANGAKGVLVWQQPKQQHKREFMLRFMQTSIPLVILCMRAKYPMIEKKDGGRRDWVRSEHLDPIQADDILFEMFVHGWLDHEHRFHRTKCSAKALEPVFQDRAVIGTDTGRKLAAWAARVSDPAPAAPSAASATTTSSPTNEAAKTSTPTRPVFTDKYDADCFTMAEREARKGSEALTEWRRAQSRDIKQALVPHADYLKALAARVDNGEIVE